jgi:NAD(P)-dependent dehydrogenase (short-subunit alcohol dehydrogenase family)
VFTRVLAIELRDRDITVNAVCLEADTPCAPSQVAGVVAHLLSDHGHRLTGQVLRVGDPRLPQ